MADVKWIKIVVDIFNNRKIEQIEAMPNGDTYLVIWIKLLCLAGSVNDNGAIYITREVSYTEDMIATRFKKPLSVIRLALDIFQKFGMIKIINDIVHVSNWSKYQNIEGLDRVREQGRLRVGKYRETKRLLQSTNDIETGSDLQNVTLRNVTDRYNVTQCNGIDIDKEIDKEIEKKPPKPPKGDDERFNTFWSSYPKKVSKETAKKAFAKIKLTDVLMAEILCALEKYKLTEQWTKDNGQYIPNPTTWLNQKRWEDEIQEVAHGANARDNAAHSKTSPFEYLSTAF